jgi:hypothetical protein
MKAITNKLKETVTGWGEVSIIKRSNGITNQSGFDFKFVRNQIGCNYNSKPKDENDCDFSCPDGFTDPVEFATDVLMAKAAKDTLIAFIDEVIHSIELDDLTNDRIDWIKERCGIIDMSVTETTDNSKTTTYTIKICF